MLNRILRTGKNLAAIGSHTVSNIIKTNSQDVEESVAVVNKPEKPSESLKISATSSIKQNLLHQASLKGKSLLSAPRRAHQKIYSRWVPPVQLEVIGNESTINLKNLTIPAVLFISHKENAELAAEYNKQLIERFFPEEMPFYTGNIILLEEIPSFARSIVRRELKKTYNTILRDWLKDPKLGQKWVHILPDWENQTIESFHLSEQRPLLSSIVLAPGGKIQAVINNPEPLEDIFLSLSQCAPA